MLKQFGLVPTLLSSASDPYMDSAQPFWGGQTIWREILETTADIEPTRSTAFGAESTAIVVAMQAAYIEGKHASAQAALDEAASQDVYKRQQPLPCICISRVSRDSILATARRSPIPSCS